MIPTNPRSCWRHPHEILDSQMEVYSHIKYIGSTTNHNSIRPVRNRHAHEARSGGGILIPINILTSIIYTRMYTKYSYLNMSKYEQYIYMYAHTLITMSNLYLSCTTGWLKALTVPSGAVRKKLDTILNVYVWIHVCMYVCMHVCMYVCI